jgi:hypothetical protein
MNKSDRRTLSEQLLALPVRGRHLRGATFGDEVAEPSLVVFLRHFG